MWLPHLKKPLCKLKSKYSLRSAAVPYMHSLYTVECLLFHSLGFFHDCCSFLAFSTLKTTMIYNWGKNLQQIISDLKCIYSIRLWENSMAPSWGLLFVSTKCSYWHSTSARRWHLLRRTGRESVAARWLLLISVFIYYQRQKLVGFIFPNVGLVFLCSRRIILKYIYWCSIANHTFNHPDLNVISSWLDKFMCYHYHFIHSLETITNK